MHYFHRILTTAFILFTVASAGVAQLTASRDGKVDPSFGDNGVKSVFVDPNHDLGTVLDLEFAADGKVVALGFFLPSGQFASGLYRFLPNGEIDTSFGSDGLVLLANLSWHVAFDVVIQPDGKILLAGYKDQRAGPRTLDLMMLRLNADGSLDTTFGNQGLFLKDLSIGKVNSSDALYSLALQPNGKIIASGTSDKVSSGTGHDRDLVVIRLTADGVLDQSFGTQGVFQTPSSKASSQVLGSQTATAIQSDGKILAGISYGVYLNNDPLMRQQFSDLFRIDPSGTMDSSFSDDGKLELGQGYDNFQKIHVFPDGRVRTLSGTTRISQIDANGNLDASFGNGGQVIGNWLWDMTVDSLGRSVVVESQSGNPVIRRFLSDGTPDIKFGRSGISSVNSSANVRSATRLKIDDSGDLIIGGLTGQYTFDRLMLTRHFGRRKL